MSESITSSIRTEGPPVAGNAPPPPPAGDSAATAPAGQTALGPIAEAKPDLSQVGALAENAHPIYSDECVRGWLRHLIILHDGHWNAARRFENLNIGIGLLTAVFATVSGTTAFTQLGQQGVKEGLGKWLQVAVGVFALLAAALGSVQAFFRSSELAARHKQAAQKFGKLRRELEEYFDLGLPTERDTREKLLTMFRYRWDAADEESPPIPKKPYEKAKTEASRLAHYWPLGRDRRKPIIEQHIDSKGDLR